MTVHSKVLQDYLQTTSSNKNQYSHALWILTDQDTPHDLINAKQMNNKTDIYWKNGPGNSLPPDPYKYFNHVNLHRNSIQDSFSLLAVTFWHHNCIIRIYECQQSVNRPRKESTQGRILGHRESKLTTQILIPKGGY